MSIIKEMSKKNSCTCSDVVNNLNFHRREDPRDAVLFSPKVKAKNLDELPAGSNIG
jgi:hypothetical protein